jgi:hypothetical protein
MGGSTVRISISLVVLVGFCGGAKTQAVAEYARSDRRSATSSTKADKASKGIGGVWGRLDGMLKGTPEKAGPVRSGKASTRSAHGVKRSYEDPRQIRPGMRYEEVVRRFGPPYYGVSTSPDTRTLAYVGKDGGVDIELQGDKVTKVAPEKPQEMAAAAQK